MCWRKGMSTKDVSKQPREGDLLVHQGEYGFTREAGQGRRIYTSPVTQCTVVTVVDIKNGVGMLMHIDTSSRAKHFLAALDTFMSSLVSPGDVKCTVYSKFKRCMLLPSYGVEMEVRHALARRPSYDIELKTKKLDYSCCYLDVETNDVAQWPGDKGLFLRASNEKLTQDFLPAILIMLVLVGISLLLTDTLMMLSVPLLFGIYIIRFGWPGLKLRKTTHVKGKVNA